MSKPGLKSGNNMRFFILFLIMLFIVSSSYDLNLSFDNVEQSVGYANPRVQKCGCSKCHSIELDGCTGCHSSPNKKNGQSDEDSVISERDPVDEISDSENRDADEEPSLPEKQSDNENGVRQGGEFSGSEGVKKGNSK